MKLFENEVSWVDVFGGIHWKYRELGHSLVPVRSIPSLFDQWGSKKYFALLRRLNRKGKYIKPAKRKEKSSIFAIAKKLKYL